MPWPKGKAHSLEHVQKRSKSLIDAQTRRKKPRVVNGIEEWECSTCKEWKSRELFYKDKKMHNGLKSQCKSCHSKTSIESRDTDKHRRHNRAAQRKRWQALREQGAIASEDLQKLKQILGWQCLCCGLKDFVVWDHIIPVSKSGSHSPLNLQPLCKKCNERKGVQSSDWRSPEQIQLIEGSWAIEFHPPATGKPG